MRRFLPAFAALASGASAHAAETISYTYDARGRLTQVTRAGTMNRNVTGYTHDKADNRTGKTTQNPTPP